MKQSKRLISTHRVRLAIFNVYDIMNPDNKPREIASSVFTAIDSAVGRMIVDMVEQEDCSTGRLKESGYFAVAYQPE